MDPAHDIANATSRRGKVPRMYVQRSALALMLAFALPLACAKPSSSDGAGTAASSKAADDDTKKGDKATESTKATEVAPPADTSNEVIQDTPFGSVGWVLENDGAVKADVRDKSGNPVADDFAGTLAAGDGADRKIVALAPLDGTTLFGATLPSFASDLTAVTYALKQGADAFNGTFYVPAGGSSVLTEPPAAAPAAPAATGTAAPAAPATTGGTQAAMAPTTTTAVGPNGGVVQMIGDQRVELVSDQATGEVRAYLLDAANKIMPLGDRKITLGVVADHPELVTLQPAEGGNYAVASWGIKIDPLSLTIAVRDGKRVHAGVIGWRPGMRLETKEPMPVRVSGKRGWAPPKKPLERGRVIDERRSDLEAKLKLDEEARAKRRKEHPEERRIVAPGKDRKGPEGKRDGDEKRPRGDEGKDLKDLKDGKDLKDLKDPKDLKDLKDLKDKDRKHEGDDKRPRKDQK